MRITMIGHSTLLLETSTTRLLTDPYFGIPGNIAYERVNPPAKAAPDIGRLDGVLVSHGHWDHTDRRFFRALDPTVPILIPAGTSVVFRLKGARHPVPMRPWHVERIGDAVITTVPASHIARSIGFVVRAPGCCVYFAGDTFHRPFMSEIGRQFAIDVALLPVTTYRIPLTMGESGAVKAVRAVGATTVIPIHLGLQPRSPLLRTRQSVSGFERRLREAGVDADVVVLDGGESWESRGLRVAAAAG